MTTATPVVSSAAANDELLVFTDAAATKVGALLARLSRGAGRNLNEDVVAVLVALQALVLAAPDAIGSIDVNPLLIGPEGALAVDALIVPRRA